MSKIISGVSLSQEIKSKMKEEVKQLVKIFNRPPHLAVICVGDNPASISYVKGKEKDCLEVGINNDSFR
jgi:methylenetetrahydrofolate dehydrogenase (NADP+)/methenyltetrahydrofolate cyclohydrolase